VIWLLRNQPRERNWDPSVQDFYQESKESRRESPGAARGTHT
jgi:hypothetical protein